MLERVISGAKREFSRALDRGKLILPISLLGLLLLSGGCGMDGGVKFGEDVTNEDLREWGWQCVTYSVEARHELFLDVADREGNNDGIASKSEIQGVVNKYCK